MQYQTKLTPRSEREALIQKRVQASTETDILYDFRGDKAVLKIISLPIDTPVYRMDNCRTFSEQQDVIAKENLDPLYFKKGQELSTVQDVQHGLLARLAKRESSSVSSIVEVLKKEGQRAYILITSTGVVVNGNRRLSAMRELYAAEESVTSKWAHVRCLVLPADTSPDEVDDIEANEQARPQTKLEYDWVGEAQLVRRQVNKARTPKQVADQLRRTEADIKNLLQAIDEADLYLSEWAKKPGQYSLVSGDAEQIFGDLPKRLVGKTAALQDASRAIAWSLFDNRDKFSGRIYALNAAFGKLAEEVLTGIANRLDLSTKSHDTELDDDDDGFSIDIDAGSVTTDFSAVIQALKDDETKEEAVEALIEASQDAIERERGTKTNNAALKALSQVQGKLAGIDLTTAGADTYPAITKQIASIRDVLGKIEKRLDALKASQVKK